MGETVGVTELRRNLGAYVRRASDGERLLITNRGRPVAELGPLPSTGANEALIEEATRRLSEIAPDAESCSLVRVLARLAATASWT